MESKNKFSSISEHVFHLPLCHVEHSRAQIRHQIQRGRLHYVRQRNKSIPLPLRHAFHGQGKEQKVNLSTNSSLKIMVILNFQGQTKAVMDERRPYVHRRGDLYGGHPAFHISGELRHGRISLHRQPNVGRNEGRR